MEDSDLDGLSDITVSSVHTSDLSSFEEESEDEEPLSDSSKEGELSSDGLNFFQIMKINCIMIHEVFNMASTTEVLVQMLDIEL